MAQLEAVLFDFDNTLVNTKHLKPFRDSRDFASITSQDRARTSCYRPVVRLLRRLKEKGIRTGLVTNSPRSYVEPLLQHHGLSDLLDEVVTYSDVGATGKKPSPHGINKALEALGIDARQNVVYVGDEYIDVVAAYRAGVIPIVATWGSRESVSTPPAASLSSAGLLEATDDVDEIMLFAERCAEHKSRDFERKAAHFLPLDEHSEIPTIRQKLKTFCLGRYFSQKSVTTAQLHDSHALSCEIARKDSDPNYRPPSWMAEMLLKIAKSAGLYLFDGARQVDVITIVPHKPGKQPRLEYLLAEMSTMAESLGWDVEFRPDLLYFDKHAAKSLRGLGTDERRHEQNEHLHAEDVDLEGKVVIVIDDVITTGATINRALELLEENGAEVYGLGIAKTVSIVEDTKHCTMCGRAMLIRKHIQTGERFWGCSGYHENRACTHTEPFEIIPCPKCARPLRIQKNKAKGTLFYGCTGWRDNPPCRYTKNI